MKNLAKLIAIGLLASSTATFANGGGEHGGGHEKKKPQMISDKDLDQMKQSQLLTYLSNANYQSSEYAVYYFEQKGAASVQPLLKYLKKNEDDDKIVSAVIYTLGRIGPRASKAVPVVMKFLKNENTDIQKTAISTLGKLGKASDPAVPEIANRLNDKNEWTRTLALRSLKDIGTPQSKAIATQYENKLKLEEVRKNAALMGEKVEEPKAAEPEKKKVEAKAEDKKAEKKH